MTTPFTRCPDGDFIVFSFESYKAASSAFFTDNNGAAQLAGVDVERCITTEEVRLSFDGVPPTYPRIVTFEMRNDVFGDYVLCTQSEYMILA